MVQTSLLGGSRWSGVVVSPWYEDVYYEALIMPLCSTVAYIPTC